LFLFLVLYRTLIS